MGKRYKAEEIVMKLREIELFINQGMDVVQACRQAGISDQSKKYILPLVILNEEIFEEFFLLLYGECF